MNLPSIYLIPGSGLSHEQLNFIRNALGITPVAGIVVAKPELMSLASEFSQHIILDNDKESALITRYLAIAKELNAPLAIVTESSDAFKAIYEDSSQEIIQC